jgi:tetratricopeptide (TPR) repeat protein
LGKTRADIYNEKVSLIYEYDKKSPLFVRMAHIELQRNNIERAVDILNSGLRIYPYFASAHFLLGKAFTRLGSYGLAIKAIKAGSELIHSRKSFDYYFREIEEIKKQKSSFEVSQRTSFFSHELDNYEEQESIAATPNEPDSIDDNLEQIADDIKNARINPSSPVSPREETPIDQIDHQIFIASETLAKIYIAQGELNEAIETYKRLIKKTPEKEEYYLQKIKEIEEQLDS